MSITQRLQKHDQLMASIRDRLAQRDRLYEMADTLSAEIDELFNEARCVLPPLGVECPNIEGKVIHGRYLDSGNEIPF